MPPVANYTNNRPLFDVLVCFFDQFTQVFDNIFVCQRTLNIRTGPDRLRRFSGQRVLDSLALLCDFIGVAATMRKIRNENLNALMCLPA